MCNTLIHAQCAHNASLGEKKYEKRFLLEVVLKEDGGYLIRCAHIAASIALNDES